MPGPDDIGHALGAPWRALETPWRGAKVAANAVQTTADMMGKAGRIMSIVVLIAIVWALWKLLGLAKPVAIGIADGYTGGGASKAKSVRDVASKRGRETGARVKVAQQRRSVPPVGGHSGHETTVVSRTARPDGRPARVVVCAPGPGEAQALIARRFSGITWTPSGVRLCTAGGNQNDYTYVARYPRAAAPRRAPSKRKPTTTKTKAKVRT